MAPIELSVQERRQLATWLGFQSCCMTLLWSAERDGCSAEMFKKKCNYRSPTLTVVQNTAGYVFGGYAPVPWVGKHDTRLTAETSFLYRLRKDGNTDFMRFAADGEKAVVWSYNNHGPLFGNTSGYAALRPFYGTITKKPGEDYYACDMYVDIKNGYQTNGQDNNALHGGCTNNTNIEVYAVEDGFMRDPGQEWRQGLDFANNTCDQLREEITRFQPPEKLFIPKANILLLGEIGAGKSSFINSINSHFQGRISAKATSGSAGQSVTTVLRQYEVRPRGSERALNLRLCDTMGLEQNSGLDLTDIPYIMDGNVRDGFQFNPVNPLTPRHPDFNHTAKEKEYTHVVALVLDANTVSSMSGRLQDGLRHIIMLANKRSIPMVVILTKIDEICEGVARDVTTVFRSIPVKEIVDLVADKLGVLHNAILPVKNYNNEQELKPAVDMLNLYTLRFLCRMAEDHFDNLMERKGLYEEAKEGGK